MTERASASDMSAPEPSGAPAPVGTSLPGDIAMAEVQPTGSEPREEPTGNEETDDQLSGNQPSSDCATDEQSMDNLPTCGQQKDDRSKVEQTMCEQATNDQPMCVQPTAEQPFDDQTTDSRPNDDLPTDLHTDDQPMSDKPTDDQAMFNQPTEDETTENHPADNQPMGDVTVDDQPMADQPADYTYTVNSLIAEIEKNEVIFGKDYKEYFEMHARREAFDKVCEGLFPQWSMFSAIQKKELSREVQNKWRKVRKRFFKSAVGIRKHLIYKKNIQHAFIGRTLEASAGQVINTALDKALDETFKEEQNGEQNASNNDEESVRKEQNAKGEKHVDSVNPIPEKAPLVKIPEISVKFAVPSTSAQFNGNQGHMSQIPVVAVLNTSAQFNENKGYMPQTPAAAVPSTSGQFNGTQGHISKTPTAAVPSTSAQFNENQGHMAQTPAAAMPSTSAQNNQRQNDFRGPLPPINQENQANMNNIPLLNPFVYNPSIDPNIYQPIHYLTSPMPAVVPFLGLNDSGEWIQNDIIPLNNVERSIDCASHLCAMMENLDEDQQCAVWPKMVALLSNASKFKPKKIKILQGALLDDKTIASRMPTTGPEMIIREPFPDLELEAQEPFPDLELEAQEPLADPQLVVQEPLADPEIVAQESLADPKLGIQQTLVGSLEDKETLNEPELEETEEEPMYPSRHGRPTNAQGEIIYPETDQEDLDEE